MVLNPHLYSAGGFHGDVIKWKHIPRYWPLVLGIHRSPVNSPHKGQRRGTLMFSLICAQINCWVNNREAGDLRRHRAHYDVNVMIEESYVAECCSEPLVAEFREYLLLLLFVICLRSVGGLCPKALLSFVLVIILFVVHDKGEVTLIHI